MTLWKKPIKLNGTLVKIVNRESVIYNLEEVNGKYIAAEDKAEISTLLSHDNYRRTLLHEIFHAIQSEYNIKLTDEEANERIADCTANGFYSLLINNRDFVLWLLEKEAK